MHVLFLEVLLEAQVNPDPMHSNEFNIHIYKCCIPGSTFWKLKPTPAPYIAMNSIHTYTYDLLFLSQASLCDLKTIPDDLQKGFLKDISSFKKSAKALQVLVEQNNGSMVPFKKRCSKTQTRSGRRPAKSNMLWSICLIAKKMPMAILSACRL